MRNIFILIFSSFFFTGEASFQFNKNIQDCYLHIIDLEFDQAKEILAKEQVINSYNGLILLQENYIDFLTVLIGEDQEYFKQKSRSKKERLDKLKMKDKSSPYYLYCQAEIHLQWAFSRLKFEDYLTAAYEIQRAYALLKKNKILFPNFEHNRKSLALIYTIVGSIPENYQWIVRLAGMEGNVAQGISDLYEYSNSNSFLFGIQAKISVGVFFNFYTLGPEKLAGMNS